MCSGSLFVSGIIDPLSISQPLCTTPSLTLAHPQNPMADITQIFPPELVAEILGHASVPDVLRLKQVKPQSLAYYG